jgi:hypothetical protein
MLEATRAPTQWPQPIQGMLRHPLSSVCRHRARIGRGTKAQNPGGAGAKPLRHSLLPLRKPASSHNACIGLLAIVERSAPESRLFVQVESHPPEISKH